MNLHTGIVHDIGDIPPIVVMDLQRQGDKTTVSAKRNANIIRKDQRILSWTPTIKEGVRIIFRDFAGKTTSKGGKVMLKFGCIHIIALQRWGNADGNEVDESAQVGRVCINVIEINAKIVISCFILRNGRIVGVDEKSAVVVLSKISSLLAIAWSPSL